MARELFLDPPRAAGPIVLGMPADAASAMLRTMDGYLERDRGSRPNRYFAHYACGLSISVSPGPAGLVDAVELYRPERDVTVLFGDVAVFDLPADEVIRRIGSMTPVEVEDDGLTVIAPALLLALGRPTLPEGPEDSDGRYFESVLVAGPGYYDGRSETPARVQAPATNAKHTCDNDCQPPLF